jgi:outer membrane protein assembly factor BamC
VRPLLVTSLTLAAAALAGCSSGFLSGEKVDYRSGARQTQGLEVPPDLTQLAREGRFQAAAPVVSASTTATPARAAAPATAGVAPTVIGDMRVLRDGDVRWLQVPQTADQLWPQLRQFWLDAGFALEVDDPAGGVLETGWAENRAKLPQDLVRRTLGSAFDSIYDSGERDRYRMRVERTATGSEIFISHRGAQQVVHGDQRDEVRWTTRPSDPQLEAEFLSRLLVRLGSTAAEAQATVAAATPAATAAARARRSTAHRRRRSRSTKGSTAPGAVSAWHWTAAASRSRTATAATASTSYVMSIPRRRTIGASSAACSAATRPGRRKRYRVALVGSTAGTDGRTIVAVQTAEGAPLTTPVGQRIAGVLLRELR